ncbi:hypothetical protein MKW92_023641, partial [Papaver armeniacum]
DQWKWLAQLSFEKNDALEKLLYDHFTYGPSEILALHLLVLLALPNPKKKLLRDILYVGLRWFW